jgi:hypothetical protein
MIYFMEYHLKMFARMKLIVDQQTYSERHPCQHKTKFSNRFQDDVLRDFTSMYRFKITR